MYSSRVSCGPWVRSSNALIASIMVGRDENSICRPSLSLIQGVASLLAFKWVKTDPRVFKVAMRYSVQCWSLGELAACRTAPAILLIHSKKSSHLPVLARDGRDSGPIGRSVFLQQTIELCLLLLDHGTKILIHVNQLLDSLFQHTVLVNRSSGHWIWRVR